VWVVGRRASSSPGAGRGVAGVRGRCGLVRGAMNFFLIAVIVIMTVMILLASFYALVYFQSEEDSNTAYAPKVAVVAGLTLTALLVMMLPLDVANRSSDGGLPMEELWLAMYIMVAVMCVGVVPFMMFYYEAWDPEGRNWQVWTAFKYEIVTLIVICTTLLLMWAFMGYAEVPLELYAVNSTYDAGSLLMPATAPTTCGGSATCTQSGESVALRISVTLAVYIVALTTFLGWFLFTVFAGVGLVALPMDLVRDYSMRPQPLNLEEYAKQRMMLNERAAQLQQLGAKLGTDAHRKRDRRSVARYNKFKQAVYFLERDWNRVKTAYKERGGNPLQWLCQAVCGFLGSILSICWYVHILLYVFIEPPLATVLNAAFIELDGVFPLFGTVLYGVFSFYLLACVVKGCMKVGLRFFCIPIHPLRIGETMMSSFLFNVWLLLLCAVACVQFCYYAFQSYAQLTAIELLLGVQVRNLIFLSAFFRNNVFIYTMTAISSLTMLFLCIFPNDKPAIDDDDDLA